MLPLMPGPQRKTFEKLPLTQSNRGTIYHRNAWNLNLATPINQSINQSIIWDQSINQSSSSFKVSHTHQSIYQSINHMGPIYQSIILFLQGHVIYKQPIIFRERGNHNIIHQAKFYNLQGLTDVKSINTRNARFKFKYHFTCCPFILKAMKDFISKLLLRKKCTYIN